MLVTLRDIPFGNIAIEHCSSVEHITHVGDGRDIPFEILPLNACRKMNIEVMVHDFRDIPLEISPLRKLSHLRTGTVSSMVVTPIWKYHH
jgi:hypothetical protein